MPPFGKTRAPSVHLMAVLGTLFGRAVAVVATLPPEQRVTILAHAAQLCPVPLDVARNAWQRRAGGGPAIRRAAWHYGMSLLQALDAAGIEIPIPPPETPG